MSQLKFRIRLAIVSAPLLAVSASPAAAHDAVHHGASPLLEHASSGIAFAIVCAIVAGVLRYLR